MNLRFTRFSALFPYGYFVQWTINNVTPSESGVFKFTLYRSGGPEGPWEQIFEGKDQYAYNDKFNDITSTLDVLQPNSLRLFQEVHYRIICQLPSGALLEGKDETGPIFADRKMSQYLRKTQRDFRLTLKFNGLRVVLLKKRRWGVRCLKCTDKRTKEVVRPNCVECWGTGFIGGYWTPFITYARSSASNNASTIGPNQKTDSNECTFWLPDYPTLEQDDILVRLSDNRRFRIDQQLETQIQLNSVHQEISCQELPHDNILYRYPLNPNTIEPLY
jgi:hypothetical protein